MAIITLTIVALTGATYVLTEKQIAGFRIGKAKPPADPPCELIQDDGTRLELAWQEMRKVLNTLHPARSKTVADAPARNPIES
jgi:hypothetical protein